MKKEHSIKIDFKTKRIFDHFRHKYDMSYDKGKKETQAGMNIFVKYIHLRKIFSKKKEEKICKNTWKYVNKLKISTLRKK